MVTSGVLYGVGDLIAQTCALFHIETSVSNFSYDGERFLRAVFYGFAFYAPIAHLHFNFLEWFVVQYLKVREPMMPWVKTLIEQFVYWSYFSNAYYIFILSILRHLSFDEAMNAVRKNIFSTMVAQWIFWIPAQVINFKFVPLRYQLMYVLSLSLIWTTFLSFFYS